MRVIFDQIEYRYHDHNFLDPGTDQNIILKPWQTDILKVVESWNSQEAFMTFRTSGSTGTPKEIRHSKESMVKSAQKTIEYFGLESGFSAFLCLPVNFIAGTMMVVRCMVGGMDLVCSKPSSNPLKKVNKHIDFAAMTPHQVQTILRDSPEKLDLISILLIGGGPVSADLEVALKERQTSSYIGYGMTETITHVAVRSIDQREDGFYHGLAGVKFSTDPTDCLIIKANHLDHQTLLTTDHVELLSDVSFKWLGRKDRVINSGGVKIHPEIIEKRIEGFIDSRFFVAAVEDGVFGQRPALFIEGATMEAEEIERLSNIMIGILNKYEMLENIYFVDHFEETPTGKIKKDPKLYAF